MSLILFFFLILNFNLIKNEILSTCNPLNFRKDTLYGRNVRNHQYPRKIDEINNYYHRISWEPFSGQSYSTIIGDV